MARRPLTAGAGVILILLAAAAPAVAVDDGKEYVSGSSSEKRPDCEKNQPAAGTDEDSTPTSIAVTLKQELFNETLFMICSGEHWDGQDPNNRSSESDTTANESDGEVYVNPLGDCSGYDSDPDNDGTEERKGCPGGSEEPSPGNPLDLRVTADTDSPATEEDGLQAEVYFNGELWGLGRMSLWVHPDHDDRNGAVAVFLEDHSDHVFSDLLGDPLDRGDGNYLAYLLDPVQQGATGSGDCSQDTYDGSDGDGGGNACPRDNGAFTVHYGYKWISVLPVPSTSASGPALP